MEPLGTNDLVDRETPAQGQQDLGLSMLGFPPDFFHNVINVAKQPISEFTGSKPETNPLNVSSPSFESLIGLPPREDAGNSFSLRSPPTPPAMFESTPLSQQFQGTPFAGLFGAIGAGLNSMFLHPPANDTTPTLTPRASDPGSAVSGWLPSITDVGKVASVQQRKANIAAGNEPNPPLAKTSGDLVAGMEEFGNAQLEQDFAAQGLAGLTDAACGPIAIAAELRAFGINMNPASIARYGWDTGQWRADGMQQGDGTGIKVLLSHYGIDSQNIAAGSDPSLSGMISIVQSGTPVILNFPHHYMIAQAYDESTGKFFVGASGSNALHGGKDWMTIQEMNTIAGNGGRLESYIAPTQSAPARSAQAAGATGSGSGANASSQEIEAYIRQSAEARGIDPSVAVRVALGEGGLVPARQGTFSTGRSWWPFQLHYGGAGTPYAQWGGTAGMGNDFTRETGIQPGDPNGWQASVDYALNQAARDKSWGKWYGRVNTGVGLYDGLGASSHPVPLSQ